MIAAGEAAIAIVVIVGKQGELIERTAAANMTGDLGRFALGSLSIASHLLQAGVVQSDMRAQDIL